MIYSLYERSEIIKEFKSFYKEVGGSEGSKCHYNIRLDTYGCGCQHDCKYCYAKSLLSLHYEYWQNNFNSNKDDCCNLRKEH